MGIVLMANDGSIRTVHSTVTCTMFIYTCYLRPVGLLDVPSLPPLSPRREGKGGPCAELTRALLYQKVGGAAASGSMRQQFAVSDSSIQ